jgi:hypothetical protein
MQMSPSDVRMQFSHLGMRWTKYFTKLQHVHCIVLVCFGYLMVILKNYDFIILPLFTIQPCSYTLFSFDK